MRNLTRTLQAIYQIVRPFGRRRLALVLFFGFAQALSQLLSISAILPFLNLVALPASAPLPGLMASLIGYLPDMSRATLIYLTGGLMAAAFVMAAGISIYGDWLRARFTWDFAHWLRGRMLSTAQAKSIEWFAENHTSNLVKRMTQDVNQFSQVFVGGSIEAFTRTAIIIMLFAGMIAVGPSLALGAVAIVCSGFGMIYLVLHPLRQWVSGELMASWRGVYKQTTQFFATTRIARVFGREDFLREQTAKASRRQSQAQSLLPLISTVPKYILETLLFAGIILYVITVYANEGSITSMIPLLGFFALALYRMLPTVQALYGVATAITAQGYIIDEIASTLEAPCSEPTPRDKIATPLVLAKTLALRGLTFRYPGANENVFTSLNLEIEAGQSIGLIGESGAGKSTLLDLILCLRTPDGGSIVVDGIPLTTDSLRCRWQRSIGYVPQETLLLDDTIARNIAFGINDWEIDQQRLQLAARQTCVDRFIEQDLPHAYATVIGEHGVRLSGGQRQRIALARALYHAPTVLIFDEATSALDNDTEADVMDTVFDLPNRITKIFVAHRFSSLTRCDVVYRLAGGRLEAIKLAGANL